MAMFNCYVSSPEGRSSKSAEVSIAPSMGLPGSVAWNEGMMHDCEKKTAHSWAPYGGGSKPMKLPYGFV